MTALAVIGHNAPPLAGIVQDQLDRLGSWLSEHPVIQTREEAIEAAKLSKLAGNALADLDDERKAKVRPLNEQVGRINTEHKKAIAPLKAILAKLDERVSAFAKAEEQRQRAAALAARLAAEEAAQAAREAAERAREADENAEAGEVGVDLVSATTDEQAAFAAAARAARNADRADRNIGVRLPTGLGRATSLRSYEVLTVTDPVAAVTEIGLTPEISAALITASKAYRKLKGRLPAGIATATERHV